MEAMRVRSIRASIDECCWLETTGGLVLYWQQSTLWEYVRYLPDILLLGAYLNSVIVY